ncbi:crossover junction endodeoxyribonuclease RuvC [bacterium]|nr:crossover junction endodeoxyribonuclease RuvC [candidate division CSSED10-310 bacterium]
MLGVDPGSTVTGFGIVEVTDGTLKAVAYGAIKTAGLNPFPKKLERIFNSIGELITSRDFTTLAIEFPFHHKNFKTALRLGQAQGVVILAAAVHGLPVAQYAPAEIKQAVVGYGGGSKEQVAFMVRRILSLPDEPMALDTTDALAVAVCHANHHRMQQRLGAHL